jgi:hypothetical protein
MTRKLLSIGCGKGKTDRAIREGVGAPGRHDPDMVGKAAGSRWFFELF